MQEIILDGETYFHLTSEMLIEYGRLRYKEKWYAYSLHKKVDKNSYGVTDKDIMTRVTPHKSMGGLRQLGATTQFISRKDLGKFTTWGDLWENIAPDDYALKRDDKFLVKVVKQKLKDKKWKWLRVVKIPDNIKWFVASNDSGREWIAENHRTWS